MAVKSLAAAVSAFGASAKSKLANPAIGGAPEDQLRGPLETLVRDLAIIGGLPAKAVDLVGETTLAHLQTRPDYAVVVQNALAGFIELKAPGKGFDPRKFSDPHDKAQWTKLKPLPNLIYTDGNGFSLWRNGELAGKPVAFEGDIDTAGAKLQAPDSLLALFSDFFRWAPEPPPNAKQLAQVSARLRWLLRDEVLEHMGEGIEVQHEPKRKKGFGAPDHKIKCHGMILGYVEVKAIGTNLDKELKSEQFAKYREFSDNILVTDYPRWSWLVRRRAAWQRRATIIVQKTLDVLPICSR